MPRNLSTRRATLAAVGAAIPVGSTGCLGPDGAVGSESSEEAVGSDSGGPTQPIATAVDEPRATATILMTDGRRFDPQLAWVAVGGRVTWRNDDMDHDHDVATIRGRTPENAIGWSTGTLKPDERYVRTMTEPGVYDYVSTPHATRMVGRLVVGRPDPADEPALSADADELDGPEARAVFVALDATVDELLAGFDDATTPGDGADSGRPDS